MQLDRNLIKEDSIDIKYLVDKLSKKIYKIIFFILISSLSTTLINIVPFFFSKKVLSIILPYRVELYSLSNGLFCKDAKGNSNKRCKDLNTIDSIIELLGEGWSKNLDSQNRKLYINDGLPLRLTFSSPNKTIELQNLENKLSNIEQDIRKKHLKEQKNYLSTIKNITNEAVYSTDSYANSLLNTQKSIGLLEAGLKPVIFLDFFISEVTFEPSINFSNPFEFQKANLEDPYKDSKINILRMQRNNYVSGKIMIIFLRWLLIMSIFLPTIFAIKNDKTK